MAQQELEWSLNHIVLELTHNIKIIIKVYWIKANKSAR